MMPTDNEYLEYKNANNCDQYLPGNIDLVIVEKALYRMGTCKTEKYRFTKTVSRYLIQVTFLIMNANQLW